MSYFETRPTGAASALALALWRAEGAHQSLILPDGCTDLLFIPSQRRVLVVGVMTRALVAAPRDEVLGVRLQPWVAGALLGVEAARLCDQMLPLEEVSAALYARVKRVQTLPEAEEALTALSEGSLAQRAMDPRVQRAVERLQEAPQTSIAALAAQVALGARQLHRLFLTHLGVAPKHLARVFRLQRAKALSRQWGQLSALAVEAGYSDQPHLCREVRALTGLSAGRLLAKMSDSSKPAPSPLGRLATNLSPEELR